MGFASRTVSIIRYRVRGEVEGSFWDTVDSGIKKGAFRDIETSGDIVAAGWISIEDFTDNSFSGASYHRGNYVALALRIDSVKVPPRILEIHLKSETKKLLEQSDQKRLSSGQRRDLKERLRETLKSRIFPSIQVYDFIWDTSKEVVYFGSLGVKARERFEDHFKKSFGLRLLPIIPYIRAEDLLTDESERRALENLRPSSFIA